MNACDALFACARDTAAVAVTPLVDVYGPNGTCWATHAPTDCLLDCEATLNGIPACHEGSCGQPHTVLEGDACFCDVGYSCYDAGDRVVYVCAPSIAWV